MKKDFIIVGQGLAGTTLALLLIEQGYTVHIFDQGIDRSSSIVAAGMWNPVSFKRTSKTWKADFFIPLMKEVFGRFEKTLGVSIINSLDIVRIFPDVKSSNDWDARPELDAYLRSEKLDVVENKVEHPFGYGVVKQGGWMNLPVFLDAARRYFLEKKILSEQTVLETDIRTSPDSIMLHDQEAERIIICNGSAMKGWALFSHIPLTRNKGQVLRVKMDGFEMDKILNFYHFVIPVAPFEYRLGSTYEFDVPDPQPTEEVRNQLVESAESTIHAKIEVLEHKAGYRPTMRDRRPAVGFLPENNRIGIFNGLGSKGVMTAPYAALQLIEHIKTGNAIDHEIDHARFYRRMN